jgi:hypothetical protein
MLVVQRGELATGRATEDTRATITHGATVIIIEAFRQSQALLEVQFVRLRHHHHDFAIAGDDGNERGADLPANLRPTEGRAAERRVGKGG